MDIIYYLLSLFGNVNILPMEIRGASGRRYDGACLVDYFRY